MATDHIQKVLNTSLEGKMLAKEQIDALYTLGYTLYGQEKYLEALPFFTLLSLHEPSNASYASALAACHKMNKSYEAAIQYYAQALLLNPEQAEHIIHIAECQIAALHPKAAIATLEQFLAIKEAFLKEQVDLRYKAENLLLLLKNNHTEV